jgi:hypothetical protein
MRKLKALSILMIGAMFCSVPAFGQTPVFYPAKKQTAQQQSKDTGECKTWAKQTTGVDPAAPPPAPVAASGPAVGGGERVRGAARGAIVGEAIGDNAGGGAAAGAVVGGARARRNQAAQVDSANQQNNAAHAQKMDTFNRAVGACMEGRGYTVK